MGLLSIFKRKKKKPENVLQYVHQNRGLLWENISVFKDTILQHGGSVRNHTPEMEELMPVEHNLQDGLYTREIFMPKGTLVVSYIHKQNHPSFFLKGEMSVVLDTGEIKRIKAPMKVMTEIGTQRVAYMHEDCTWVCVYRTDAKNIKDAEKEVYTEDYKDLPEHVIINKELLCQEQLQD
jgi:hypothetical protein